MSRRKTQPNSRAARNLSWALIPIDGQPIRDQARQEYDKVLRELRQARLDLEQFEKLDKPGFSRWLNRQFGALMTELRQTTQRLQTSRELLFEIESEVLLANCSHVRAYERVMWRRDHPPSEQELDDSAGGEDPSGANGANPFADFEQFFTNLGGDFAHAFGAGPRRGPAQADAAPPRPTPPARLKELYRAVVRRLHPDMHRSMTPQQNEWWHQAQAAYQSGDVDQLEVILTLSEIEERGTTAKTSVSLLMRITRQFKSSLRTLKAQLQRCRREPAWNFSNLRSRGDLLVRTERVLRAELSDLRSALNVIESQIGSWARQAQTARRRPGARRRRFSRGHPEFSF